MKELIDAEEIFQLEFYVHSQESFSCGILQ